MLEEFFNVVGAQGSQGDGAVKKTQSRPPLYLQAGLDLRDFPKQNQNTPLPQEDHRDTPVTIEKQSDGVFEPTITSKRS